MKYSKYKTVTILFLLSFVVVQAQHEGHNMNTSKDSIKTHDGEEANMHDNHNMSHAFSRNLPMNRNGSGTGWLPDNSPMYGYMHHSKKWMYMFHGNIFLRYNNQDVSDRGTRGGEKFDAPNWFMAMGQRNVGDRGLFRFSAMLSLDPLTIGGEGYPLLYQSGETWRGEPLVDSQHPHDLFSELSVSYAHMFSEKADAFVYVGYPGEPAFGPVAFMHRVSSLYNPDAPIGHHWQDATHITFGVATVGFRYNNFKIEGSSFTGREPNEERYGFDKPRFDSWSARLSYNPSEQWALQVSKAWVKDVHEFGPREDAEKTTASAIHSYTLGKDKFLNSAAVWGHNKADGHHDQHSFLLESALTLRNTTIYGKYEWGEKSTENLLLDEETYGHGTLFDVNAVTLGVQQNLYTIFKTNMAAGAQVSLYSSNDELNGVYGKNPYAVQFYLRFFPGLMGTGAGK